jgi:hypothetical protein
MAESETPAAKADEPIVAPATVQPAQAAAPKGVVFTAPPHVSEVFLPSGPARVIDGQLTLLAPTDGDLRALASVGFRPV